MRETRERTKESIMKVLVTSASRHGTATEIADHIGVVLSEAELEVEVMEPDAVTSLDGYDAVVIGSGVYAGRWLGPAKAFVSRHEAALRQRRVFLFSCGPLGEPLKPDGDPDDVAALMLATEAVEHRVFPGRLDKADLKLPEKLVVAAVRAPYGDFRVWGDIDDWAREIAGAIQPQPASI